MDDEEIEHEGMAQFIPWDTYGMKVVGTARNGAEGLEKIAKYKPDLAIVDIKMPVMNGIEMIRKAKKQYPDMTFVVLSGYGDYEFTSQAMELGVRHYILKPCDESKMIPVLNKAFAELEEARKKNARSEKLETEARLLKPYAREQLFRDLLLGKAQASSGARQLVDELGGEQRMVLLLDFRLKCGFDSLERYVVGNMLGELIGGLSYNWIIVPIGMLLGYFIVAAEPAVHVLNRQVAEMTEGAIPQKAMSLSLSIGVAISVGLSMLRVLTGLPIMWLLGPGYGMALLLSFFVPPVFTAIAFDSGGVASGPMTATFLLPLAMGLCISVGGNVAQDAFGVVAMVAMTPLITIQLLGLYYKFKTAKALKADQADELRESDEDVIIVFEEEKE